MTPRQELIDELRSLLRDGATPSRLMIHIAEHNPDEPDLYGLIQACFQEAFSVPIVRGLKPQDDFKHADLKYAFLNHHLLHEIIARRADWDSFADSSWLEGLTVSDHDSRMDRSVPPELRRLWPQLSDEERVAVQRSRATTEGHLESVTLLARLAERLQMRVNELEAVAEPALAEHH